MGFTLRFIKTITMTTKALLKLYDECMTELYENSTPKGNWEELKEKYKNTDVEFFRKYTCKDSLFKEIVEKYKSKIPHKWQRQRFSTSIYLGASPLHSMPEEIFI